MTWLLNIGLAVLGGVTFPLLHSVFRSIVTRKWPALGYASVFRVCTRIVSGIQAAAATLISLRTILITKDIMHDIDPVIRSYTWFGWSYFCYDVIVMYLGHCYLEQEKGICYSWKQNVRRFLSRECLIVVHHFISFAVGFPVIAFCRKGIGDFFVACIIFAEFSTPFFSIRGIQKELQWKQGTLWIVNGLVFIVTFLIGRVLTVPYMYWKYSQYKNVAITNVPFQIPVKCNIGASLFLLLQLYWFSLLIKGVINFFREGGLVKHKMSCDFSTSNGLSDLNQVVKDRVNGYVNSVQHWQNGIEFKED